MSVVRIEESGPFSLYSSNNNVTLENGELWGCWRLDVVDPVPMSLLAREWHEIWLEPGCQVDWFLFNWCLFQCCVVLESASDTLWLTIGAYTHLLTRGEKIFNRLWHKTLDLNFLKYSNSYLSNHQFFGVSEIVLNWPRYLRRNSHSRHPILLQFRNL